MLDDSPERWGSNADVVIPIPRYHYFPESCVSFRLDGKESYLRRGGDESSGVHEATNPLRVAWERMKEVSDVLP